MNTRTVLAIAILGLFADTVSAAVASPVKGHECQQEAKGSDGSRVLVSFRFTLTGEPRGRTATWHPPHSPRDKPLRLGINYQNPTAQGLGEPASSMILASAQVPSFRWAIVEVNVDGAVSRLQIDNAMDFNSRGGRRTASIPSALGTVMLVGEGPKGPRNLDLLPQFESMREIHLRLVNVNVPNAGETVVDLSARAQRNELFRKAWAKVERMSTRWSYCRITEW